MRTPVSTRTGLGYKNAMSNEMQTAPAPESGQDDGFEAARAAILEEALKQAAFDGWTPLGMRRAAASAAVDEATLAAAFPAGVADLLDFWSGRSDAAMTAAMTGPDFAALRVREKVAFAVKARLAAIRPHKEAARRAAAMLALPAYAGRAARLAWRTANAIWRGLGDKSTDFNFYSKRAILAGVWTSVFAFWLGDDSEDESATAEFLEARIANVMEFEKLKSRVRDMDLDPRKVVEILAKRRYPA